MNANAKLAGKRALVTGSGTGIGREIALEFARQGADVVLHYAHSGRGRVHRGRNPLAGPPVGVFQANFDDLDMWLNWPGRRSNSSGRRLPGEQLGDHLEQTLPGGDPRAVRPAVRRQYPCPVLFDAANRTRHAAARRRGGLNITSVHALQALPEHSVYAGTKGAIVAYTALAVELAHQGVRVNAIAPGWVAVENYYKAIPGFGGGGPGGGAERRSRRSCRHAAGHRPAGRIPLFRRCRVHHRTDLGGRRRNDVADVAVPQFPRAFEESVWHRLCARRMTGRGNRQAHRSRRQFGVRRRG